MADTSDVDSLPSSMPSPATFMEALSSKKTMKRDDYFYLHSLIFEVEDTLFEVPRYGLPGDGSAFDAMFARGPGAPGSSDEDPIRLDADVTARDFRAMIKATYPPSGTVVADLGLDEWMSVLKLAKKWNLASWRDKAVQQSNTQVQLKTPVEKVLLARQYDVSKWLDEAYISLASREEPLAGDEIEKVGWETFGKLMLIREKRWRTPQTLPKASVRKGKRRNAHYSVEVVVETAAVTGEMFNYANTVKDVFRESIDTQ